MDLNFRMNKYIYIYIYIFYYLSANLKVLTTCCFIVHLLRSCGPPFSFCLGTFSKGVQVSFGGLYFHYHSHSSFQDLFDCCNVLEAAIEFAAYVLSDIFLFLAF